MRLLVFFIHLKKMHGPKCKISTVCFGLHGHHQVLQFKNALKKIMSNITVDNRMRSHYFQKRNLKNVMFLIQIML
jgi:hypothetical protein